MSDEEKQQLKPLFDVAPRIKEAYSLCLGLTSIYNKNSTSEEASKSINAWIERVEQSKLTCFKNFIQTLKKYQDEICNYFINRNTRIGALLKDSTIK